MKKTLLCFSTALILAGMAAPAAAAEPDDTAKQQARELMTRGRQARDQADFRAALESFTQADDIMHVPSTGLEVAKTLMAMGMLLEASAVVERIAAIPQEPDEPEAFARARAAAKELGRDVDARLAKLRADEAEAAERKAAAERAPAEAPARPRKSQPTRPSTFAIYGLTGLAIAGGGAGLGLGLWANHRKSQFENDCAPRCTEVAVDQLHATYVAANIAAAVGAASAIAAVTVYFVRPSNAELKRRNGGTASLSITANGGSRPGVSLAGTF